ncbi:MAG: GNAT family N-acetyltransferase [Deltaproteobacteria bacterium]|nr:GNAT family N-acetyltransferase [Deltaproteobacteria bacterium]
MREAPTIERIELFPVHVPFRAEVRETMARSEGGLGMAIAAEEPWQGGDFVIARLTAQDGSQGVGEAFVWLPETGVSPAQVIDAVAGGLARYVLGASPFDVDALQARMDANVARCEVAKGLLDMACWDLAGRIAGRPVCELLGGRVQSLPLAALVPLLDPGSMVSLALAFQKGGVQTFRLKLGRGFEVDRAIVARVRDALGAAARLRVDYNQAYAPAEAIEAIRAITPFGIDCAEQPVAAADWRGMAQVQRAVDVPLMAHEGCFSLADFLALADLGAVRVLGVNSERPGGITLALRAIDEAARLGMGVVLHNQPLGIASAAQAHIGAARADALGHAMELFGHVMLEDDLVTGALDCSGGFVRVPAAPGLGVTLDEEALARYATAQAVVIEPPRSVSRADVPAGGATAVREARPSDVERLVSFNLAMAKESESLALDPATLRAGMTSLLSDPTRGRTFVVEEAGEVVATLMLTTEWSDWRNGWFWWIQNVYVHPGHRRRGHYRRLHEHVRDLAAGEPDVHGLRLYVECENDGARQTYDRLGMVETRYRLYEETTRRR